MLGQTIVSHKKNKFLVKDFLGQNIVWGKMLGEFFFVEKTFCSKKIFIFKKIGKKISDTQRQK